MENNCTVKPLSTAIRSQVRMLENMAVLVGRATIVPKRISILTVIYKWQESGLMSAWTNRSGMPSGGRDRAVVITFPPPRMRRSTMASPMPLVSTRNQDSSARKIGCFSCLPFILHECHPFSKRVELRTLSMQQITGNVRCALTRPSDA